jgi:hypothetical protein
MKFLNLFAVLLISSFALTGCIEEDTTSSSSSSSGPVDALAGSKSTHSYSCPAGGNYSIEVTNGPCKSSQENYAEVFGCNQVGSFASACQSFYSCLVSNSTGDYRSYYQQNLDACAYY